MCAQAGGGPQRSAPRLIQLASATEAEGASRWQLQQGELDSFGSAMKHAAETHLLRSATTFGDEAVDFLLQFAEKSEDNPFAQEAALQLLVKTHDSNTTQNSREYGRYIFIECKNPATFDAAMAAHRLVQLADVSGGKPTLQQLAISAVGILATNHPLSKSALGTKIHRLLHFADSSQDRKVQQLALSAFQIVVDRHPENQSAAGGAAVHRLLQLAETSGDHPDVQAKALSAFVAVVSDHEANQSAAGPTAVKCLLKLGACSELAVVLRGHAINKSAAGGDGVRRLLDLAETRFGLLQESREKDRGRGTAVHDDILSALSALVAAVQRYPENQSAAGGAAVHRLLQLAETSGGHPDVQAKALSAFAAVVSDHEANQSAAGPTAVNCLLKLSHPSGDEPYVQKDALKALREVVVNHAGNTAALTAAGDAGAHGRCVLSDL